MRVLRLTALVASFACVAAAQWLNITTPGVPKTPSGTLNLGAPTPRTADGKPDFSGLWEPETTLPCNPATANCTDLGIGAQYINIAARLNQGLPMQPWAADLKKTRSNSVGDDPYVHCLPTGVPKGHISPTLKRMLQTPALLVILDEYNTTFRQIFIDGRPLPPDPNPTWTGYSTARWEGDTLVVDSLGFRDGLWLDATGTPMTDAAKVTERIRRVNFGNIEIEVTVIDPKAYTKPWTVTLKQFLVVNTDLIDYDCLENEKDSAHMRAGGGRPEVP